MPKSIGMARSWVLSNFAINFISHSDQKTYHSIRLLPTISNIFCNSQGKISKDPHYSNNPRPHRSLRDINERQKLAIQNKNILQKHHNNT